MNKLPDKTFHFAGIIVDLEVQGPSRNSNKSLLLRKLEKKYALDFVVYFLGSMVFPPGHYPFECGNGHLCPFLWGLTRDWRSNIALWHL